MSGLYSTTVLCFGAILLAGCSRQSATLHVEVPLAFHGHVNIGCGARVSNRDDMPIRVGDTGRIDNVNCPEHQKPLMVTRTNGHALKAKDDKWLTTGDGLLSAIVFDVP
jgi:hypothetical protein